MATGSLSSPLFLLGIGAPSTRASFRGMGGLWLGGACAPSAVAPVAPGIRSMLAPWLGGACAVPGVVVPVPQHHGGGGGRARRRVRVFVEDRQRPKDLPRNDDDEVLEFIRLWTIWQSMEDD